MIVFAAELWIFHQIIPSVARSISYLYAPNASSLCAKIQ